MISLTGEGVASDFLDVQQSILAELALSEDGRFADGLAELESALRSTYVALPKNEYGKLGHDAVKYALRRFFTGRHGWSVKGLEHDGGALANASTPTNVLQDRMPVYFQNIFEQRLGGEGFGLHEIAVFAAILEHMVQEETVGRLKTAYEAFQLAPTERIDEKQADEIIETYLVMFIKGRNLTGMTPLAVSTLRKRIHGHGQGWKETLLWAQDVRMSVAYTEQARGNSFSDGQFTFSDTARVIERIGDEYGRRQDLECRAMKNTLVELQEADTGRVLLSDFYKAQLSGVVPYPFQFTESVDFLRQLGAIDDSDSKQPSVILSNYIAAQTNCHGSSKFHQICCIAECDGLLGHIERHVAAPRARPAQLIQIVSSLSSDTVSAPRNLSVLLVSRLNEIASTHDGSVPLHGRLFSQWMHHAYPRECPYPHVTGEGSPLAPDEWMNQTLRDATKKDMRKYAAHSRDPLAASAGSTGGSDGELPWLAVEELFVHHREAPLATMAGTLRSMMHYTLLLSVALGLARTFKSSLTSVCQDKKKAWSLLSFTEPSNSEKHYV